MNEPMEARVREASVTMSALDGESLLSPQLMARVVSAVLAALAAQREGEASRRRDTRVGADCGCGGNGEHA
jgi:hypothetical protein